jgi:hypothetical protein
VGVDEMARCPVREALPSALVVAWEGEGSGLNSEAPLVSQILVLPQYALTVFALDKLKDPVACLLVQLENILTLGAVEGQCDIPKDLLALM